MFEKKQRRDAEYGNTLNNSFQPVEDKLLQISMEDFVVQFNTPPAPPAQIPKPHTEERSDENAE
mgnify:CR=1 FL=1|jgi:hypothetical protein